MSESWTRADFPNATQLEFAVVEVVETESLRSGARKSLMM